MSNELVAIDLPAPSDPATLAIFGDAREISNDVVDAFVVRLPVRPPPSGTPLPTALVFDLRSAPFSEFAVLRMQAEMIAQPLLLLSSVEVPEVAFEILRADDGICVSAGSAVTMRRRLNVLLELGRCRLEMDALSRFLMDKQRLDEQVEADRQRFERLAAMGTMVAGFAHEVRNPVAALRSIAEELAEELSDVGVTMPHVGRMLQMVERIERLVRTSLQFGRPTAPKRAPQRPWVIVAHALSELRPRMRGSSHELVIEAEPGLPDVNVDERQLAQVLVILINNAIDATGEPSRVLVRVRAGAKRESDGRTRNSEPPSMPAVRFEVVDDGPGIPGHILSRIFDPFFTTKSTGTGLGLSIAQQIVSENGARLEVASTPGHGAAFSVVVPTEASVA
ncbi:MAG: hypothetical protein HOW73_11065 [Polyangiaceae bacterium]|nr:hypothetical protein [Polyangiaceae bacterium]